MVCFTSTAKKELEYEYNKRGLDKDKKNIVKNRAPKNRLINDISLCLCPCLCEMVLYLLKNDNTGFWSMKYKT